MAFPTSVSVTTPVTTNATTWNINVPDHSVDDILLIAVGFDGAPTVNSIGALSGSNSWTLNLINTANGTNNKLYAAWLRSTAARAAQTVAMALSATEQGIARCWAISGAHTTTAPAVGTATTGSSTAPDPPALNPAGWDVEDTWWLALANTDAAVTATTFPANMDASTQFTDVSGGGNGAGLHTIRLESAVASLDPSAFGLSATETWVAQTLAIRPAPFVPPAPIPPVYFAKERT